MISVANLNDLLQGIKNREDVIEITGSFAVDRQISIFYPVTIRGEQGASITLQRQQGYAGVLFYIGEKGDLTLNHIAINGNKKEGTGGDDSLITADLGNITLDDAVLEENRSASGGSGVYLAGAAVCTMKNSAAIRSCEASGGGAGIFVSSGCTLDASKSAIVSNSGIGGGGLYAIGNVRLQNCFIADNDAGRQAGGGIYAAGPSCIVNIEASSILNNSSSDSGGGIYGYNGAEITVDASTIGGNNGRLNGGGVGIAASGAATTFTAVDCSFEKNSSTSGGGIYGLSTTTNISLQQCRLAENTAANGGGIYVYSAGLIASEGTTIAQNTASTLGGGICITNEAMVHLEDCTVEENRAGSGGNGIYNGGSLGIKGTVTISDGVSIPSSRRILDVEGTLNSSKIQLETSDYVTPGSGAPIVVAMGAASYQNLNLADADAFVKPQSGFENWKVYLNGDHTQVLLAPAASPTQYEISFNGNGSCCTPAQRVPEPIYVYKGSDAELPLEIPKRKCYTFVEWNTSRSGCGTGYAPGQKLSDVEESLVLYAIWKQKLMCSCCCRSMCKRALRS